MPVSPARFSALRVLEKIIQERPVHIIKPVQELLDDILRNSECSAPDRGLATELVYGVLRIQSRLELIIRRFLRHPSQTPLPLKLILYIATYELLYLDRIPAYATVNAATDLAKKRFGRTLSGVVNGILRSIIRMQDTHLQTFTQAELEKENGFVAVSGVPLWIASMWEQQYGASAMRRLCEAASCLPWVCIRVNAARDDASALLETLASIPSAVRIGAWGIMVKSSTNISEIYPDGIDSLIHSGRISIQGAGSLRILDALGLFDIQGSVWDACAGRGGKTFALIERGINVVLASDTSAYRLKGLRREAKRLCVQSPSLVLASASHPPLRSDVQFDTVLVDVPCSGLGTLARHPDARLIRKPEHLDGLIQIQGEIMESVWKRVKCGGRLAYITCTVNLEENEHRIDSFLTNHPEASLAIRHSLVADDAGTDIMFGAVISKK